MTFVINLQGRVYQKDLGPDTAILASSMTGYNPDATWKLVEVQPQILDLTLAAEAHRNDRGVHRV